MNKNSTVTEAGMLSSSPSFATTCSCLCTPLGSLAEFSYCTDRRRRSYSDISALPLRRSVELSISNMNEILPDVAVNVSLSFCLLPVLSIRTVRRDNVASSESLMVAEEGSISTAGPSSLKDVW